jgi:hypothetical protein
MVGKHQPSNDCQHRGEPGGSNAAGSIHEPVCEGRCTRAAYAAKPMIVAHPGFSRKLQSKCDFRVPPAQLRDDYGDEQIYWYPYDMILDGDTGAVEYVPV